MAVKRFSNSLISQSGQDKVTNFIAGYSPAIDEMDLIARAVVGAGGALNIEFNNIPQAYQHLQIRCTIPGGTATSVLARLNLDTGSNYAAHVLFGDGSTAGASASVVAGTVTVFGNSYASQPGVFITEILDYSSSSKATTTRSFYGGDQNGSGSVGIFSGLWTSTAPVNSIRLLFNSGTNFPQNTTATLYGIIG